MVTNHQTGTLRVVTSLTLKELLVFFLGGGYRSRTDDPLLAKQVL